MLGITYMKTLTTKIYSSIFVKNQSFYAKKNLLKYCFYLVCTSLEAPQDGFICKFSGFEFFIMVIASL